MAHLVGAHCWLFSLVLVSCAATDAEGRRWLESNAQKPGVVAHQSGFSYRVLKEATVRGPHPMSDSPCVLHYQVTNPNPNPCVLH